MLRHAQVPGWRGSVVGGTMGSSLCAVNADSQARSILSGGLTTNAQTGPRRKPFLSCSGIEMATEVRKRPHPMHDNSADTGALRISRTDQNLRGALLESRQRWRDLVSLAADFVFETDATGRFTFIMPDPALGWSAAELLGQPCERLLAGHTGQDMGQEVGQSREIRSVRRCRCAGDASGSGGRMDRSPASPLPPRRCSMRPARWWGHAVSAWMSPSRMARTA